MARRYAQARSLSNQVVGVKAATSKQTPLGFVKEPTYEWPTMMDKLEESKGEPRTMNMPGFTAEASLSGMRQRYLSAESAVAFAGGEGVVPQATPVPDWIIDFYEATGGGPGIGGGGGGGGGSFQTVQQCLNKAEDGYNACRQYCYIGFGDSPSNWAAKQRCVADCSSAYTAAKNNCFRT